MYSNVFITKCDLELFWNGSVHEFYRLKELIGIFGASEHFMSVVEKKGSLIRKGWSRVVNFFRMQMSLVMSLRFIFGHH